MTLPTPPMYSADQLTYFELTSDADSPDPVPIEQPTGGTVTVPLSVAVGRLIGLSPDLVGDIGTGPDNPGKLAGIRGYRVVGGPTGNQWLITPEVTAAVRAQFAAIPGAPGWTTNAAQTYANIGLILLNDLGVPQADVINALQQLYNAAQQEVVSRVNAGHNVPGIVTPSGVVPAEVQRLTGPSSS